MQNTFKNTKVQIFLRIFSIADAFNIKTRFSLAEIFSLISGRFCLCKYAFTLAEVLITLGIIGIVAAMTLPTLVQNHKNAELQTGLKKAYSVLS